MAKLRLEEILEENDISKNAFAKALGLKPPNVRPFFRNGYNPKLQTLATWAVALGCSISALYDERADRPKGVKVAKTTKTPGIRR